MKELGTSILITSLNVAMGASLTEKLANLLSLHYASCKDVVEYDLFDSKAMLNNCGLTYLKKRERSALRGVAEYENSVIFIDYDLLWHNYDLFHHIHPMIYLRFSKHKLSKDDAISSISYEERNKYLEEKADLVIDVVSDSKLTLSKIVKEIGEKL